MWIEVATLEHLISPRIRKCPNQTVKSPYIEEHHLHRWDPTEWRHSCVAQVSARCWALTVSKRSVINIQRHLYANCGFGLSSDQQILHYWSAADFGLTNTTARWEHVWRTEHVWNLSPGPPEPPESGLWRSRRWTRDNGSVDDGARKRVHSGSESRQRHNYTSAGFPQITHSSRCTTITVELFAKNMWMFMCFMFRYLVPIRIRPIKGGASRNGCLASSSSSSSSSWQDLHVLSGTFWVRKQPHITANQSSGARENVNLRLNVNIIHHMKGNKGKHLLI